MAEIEKLEDVLLRYVSNYGRRHSNREKQNGYLYVQAIMEELHYPVSFEQMGSGMARVGLCIIGDLKRADNVFIAPFDTPRKTRMPGYRYYPLDDEKTKKEEMKAYGVDTLLGVLSFVVVMTLVYVMSHNILLAVAAGWIGFLLYTWSRSNYCNFSKSSASLAVITHMAMMKAGNPEEQGKNAYVMLDRCAESRAGLDMFLKHYEEDLRHMKHIVYLDCLANGEKVFTASAGRRLELGELQEELTCARSDHAMLLQSHPEVEFLMTGEEKDGIWTIENIRSSKDKKVNMKRLKRMEAALLQL
jgi:hypothetical protein